MIIMSVHHHHHPHHQRHDDYHVSWCSSSSSSSSSLSFLNIRFKCPARPELRCRRCVDMIIMMTAGDAEDAS